MASRLPVSPARSWKCISLIVNIPAELSLIVNINNMMVQKNFDEAVSYAAPEVISMEISVEKGFASSDPATFEAPNYEEGITF